MIEKESQRFSEYKGNDSLYFKYLETTFITGIQKKQIQITNNKKRLIHHIPSIWPASQRERSY